MKVISGKRSLFLTVSMALFLCYCFLSEAADSTSEEVNDEKTPIIVNGDVVEYLHAHDKVIGTGHVVIDYEGEQLQCDKITVLLHQKEAFCEGNVKLTKHGSVFTGDYLVYNFGTKSGDVSKASGFIMPAYYAKAKRVEGQSGEKYSLTDNSITTCDLKHPHYRIESRSFDIYPGRRIVARNAFIRIGDIPVFYLPYYSHSLEERDSPPVQLLPGHNKKWGSYVLGKWRYRFGQDQQIKGNILTDYREKQGPAGGLESFYQAPGFGRGSLRTYYLDDPKLPEQVNQHQRYRAQLRHQVSLLPDTYLTAEANHQSDRKIIQDFFPKEEFEVETTPDTYVSVIQAKPDYTLSLLARKRINPFFDVVERLPELRLDTRNHRLGETPFYLRQEVQSDVLNREFDGTQDSQSAYRLDSNTTLRYALSYAGFSITPRMGTRQTLYTRGVDNDGDFVRGVFDTGVDISTKFYRVYSFTTNLFGLDWNEIRHIFTPSASYNYRPEPTVTLKKLQLFDAIDRLDSQQFIRLSLDNKLQTKSRTKKGELYSRDIFRLIPSADFHVKEGNWTRIGGRAEFFPYPWLGIEGSTTYESERDVFDTANLDFYISKNDWLLGMGHRYVRDASSQLTAQLDWRISDDWGFRVYDRYEFDENRSDEFEAAVSRNLHCWILDFVYNHSQVTGDSFYAMLRLTAFPNAPYRPSRIYQKPKPMVNVEERPQLPL